jgi:two-component system, chemotaxis family, chemotaxis protein CheY
LSGRAHIVCVDDEQAILNQLSAQLSRRFGSTHLVECAESAEEALGLIESIFAAGDRVELVICDQVMPGMKGDHFLEAVHGAHPETMKVLLTGQAGLGSAIYAINHAGLDRYVEKPWEVEDLSLSIQSLLVQYRLRADLERHRLRLERRGRDLQQLHQAGRELASTVEPDRMLALTCDAARSVCGAPTAAVVAVVAVGQRPRWAGLPASDLTDAARREIEACLTRLRTSRRVEGPAPCPPGLGAFPLHQADLLFGWLLVPGGLASDPDTGDLFAILADQAAANLNRVRLLEERLASERLSAMGRMISALAHDLRNPMTAIKGYAGMIDEFDLPRDREKECARFVIEESDRMGAMIEEVLDFARGERPRLEVAPIALSDLAARVHRLVEPALRAKGVSFRAELAYGGPIVVDADRLQRAILNITSNALDVTEAGGTLTFSSSLAPTGGVEISLQDTGPGIPQELQARVFEPFFTHGKARGIGLGMAIARRIVEEHGGVIELQSEPGRGARFTLRLPHAHPAAGAHAPGDTTLGP